LAVLSDQKQGHSPTSHSTTSHSSTCPASTSALLVKNAMHPTYLTFLNYVHLWLYRIICLCFWLYRIICLCLWLYNYLLWKRVLCLCLFWKRALCLCLRVAENGWRKSLSLAYLDLCWLYRPKTGLVTFLLQLPQRHKPTSIESVHSWIPFEIVYKIVYQIRGIPFFPPIFGTLFVRQIR